MASDLISRSALLKVIEESKPLNWTDSESEIQADFDYKCFADMVKNQPTAYDVGMTISENYIERLCNAVVKTLVETFENLTIEDVNMYRLGYTKAIDDFAETLIPRLTDAIYPKDVEGMSNLINDVAERLKAGETDG